MPARTCSPKAAAAIAASGLVAGFALATHAARSHGWVQAARTSHSTLLAPVRPADRATVLTRAPAFTWPEVNGAERYAIALTFPDGHTETRTTRGNWFAWDRPVPTGRYRWQVLVAGRARVSGDPHWFVVDEAVRG
jgi:hypothetical protein